MKSSWPMISLGLKDKKNIRLFTFLFVEKSTFSISVSRILEHLRMFFKKVSSSAVSKIFFKEGFLASANNLMSAFFRLAMSSLHLVKIFSSLL